MAVYCTYCEMIYRRSHHNCLACGGKLTQDSRPESELLQRGYRYAGESGTGPENGQDDFYTQLHTQFEQQPAGTAGDPAAAAAGFSPDGQDFFGRYAAQRTAEPSRASAVYDDPPQIHYEEPEPVQPERLEPAFRPRERRRERRISAWRLPSVDWYLVLRVLPYLCGGLLLVFLWSQRFVIAAALMETILAFVPCILVVLGIAWLFRSIFHP